MVSFKKSLKSLKSLKFLKSLKRLASKKNRKNRNKSKNDDCGRADALNKAVSVLKEKLTAPSARASGAKKSLSGAKKSLSGAKKSLSGAKKSLKKKNKKKIRKNVGGGVAFPLEYFGGPEKVVQWDLTPGISNSSGRWLQAS